MKTNQLKYAAALTLATILASATTGWAAGASPFVGHWEATDIDGSDIRLSIGGPPAGPFQITITDSYISYCNGGPGIVRGAGLVNPDDPNLLEAELTVECLRTGESESFSSVLEYHPYSDVITTADGGLSVIVYHRPGKPQAPPPELSLRVNYGHEWVESFYEGGHLAWIAVTESDGTTVKATAEVVTEPKDFWDGETGFQTNPEDWDPEPPDIQSDDWVYAWIDNGASAQVQIGEVGGFINFESDSVEGSINAPWIPDSVEVECHPWGAPEPTDMKYSSVIPDGEDTYACSWSGEWSFQSGQDIGVAYTGPDGHWVANAFTGGGVIVGSETGDWFWFADFEPSSSVSAYVYGSNDLGVPPLWHGLVATDENGFASVDPSMHDLDLAAGNYLVVADSSMLRGLVLEPITIDVFDFASGLMAGSAPEGRDVYVVAADSPDEADQIVIQTQADDSGSWSADFDETFTNDWLPWSFAQIFDEDGDANEAITPPPLGMRVNYGHDWVESFYEAGHLVDVWVTQADGATIKAITSAITEPKDFWGGESGFTTEGTDWQGGGTPDLQPNDWVFAQVDNGVAAQVQLGDIQGGVTAFGQIYGVNDNITGTIAAPWIAEPVPVECIDWGSGQDPPVDNNDGGVIATDGSETYYCEWDRESEWDVEPWQDIGVAYSAPDGHWVANAFRAEHWMAEWTHDLGPGSWSEVEHSYYFDWAFTEPYSDSGQSTPRSFGVSSDAQLYVGYVLIGPWSDRPVQAWNGETCEVVSSIHPDQPTRLVWGWVNDFSMTYDVAASHFGSFTVDAILDENLGDPIPMAMGNLIEFYDRDARMDHICDLTEHP